MFLPSKTLMDELVHPKGWSAVGIMANGAEIEIKIKGVSTATFTEKQDVPTEGCMCLQAHAGEPYEIMYKDIVLRQLED